MKKGPTGRTSVKSPVCIPMHRSSGALGEISAWNNQDFVAAVKQTRRNNLIMAGVTIDVCLAFPAMQAVEAGFVVHAVIDASGGDDNATQQLAVERMIRAGVTCTNWVAIAAELQRDWRIPTVEHMGRIFHEHHQHYGMLIDSFTARQAPAKPEFNLVIS